MATGGSNKRQFAVTRPSLNGRGAYAEQMHGFFGADPFRHLDGMLHWLASTGYPIFGNPFDLIQLGRYYG